MTSHQLDVLGRTVLSGMNSPVDTEFFGLGENGLVFWSEDFSTTGCADCIFVPGNVDTDNTLVPELFAKGQNFRRELRQSTYAAQNRSCLKFSFICDSKHLVFFHVLP